MIKIENMTYKYKFSKNILENINLSINEGEIVAIIGKNGSGKSTLAKLISGIIKPKDGSIKVDDIDTKVKKDELLLRQKVGILFQNPDNQIIFPVVKDDLEFALKNLGLKNCENRIKSALDKVDMTEYYQKDTYNLSLGQKQRINIAGILAVDTKYIVMDEPTTMIDSKGKEKVYDIIESLNKKGYTFIIVTNNSDEILLADRIVVLENKSIKKVIKKEEIFDNIELLEESDIKLPDVVEMIINLRKEGRLNIEDIDDFSKKGLINKILEVTKND